MLELKIYHATKNGKNSGSCLIFTDERYTKEWQPRGMYQFVLDQKVRHMTLTKQALEDLDAFPVILINNQDKTSELLPEFIKQIEEYMGKLEYTNKRTPMEKGVIKYLQENGVKL